MCFYLLCHLGSFAEILVDYQRGGGISGAISIFRGNLEFFHLDSFKNALPAVSWDIPSGLRLTSSTELHTLYTPSATA